MQRLVYITLDNLSFDDGQLVIRKPGEVNLHIKHNACFKELNTIKKKVFGDRCYKLCFEGNRILPSESYNRLIGVIKRAKEGFFAVSAPSKPRHTSRGINRPNSILINKSPYLQLLHNLHVDSEPLITLSEWDSQTANGILFQIETMRGDYLIVWESSSPMSKAAYVFIANQLHRKEICLKLQAYIENKQQQNKRQTLLNNDYLKAWLSFVGKIDHGSPKRFRSRLDYIASNKAFPQDRYITSIMPSVNFSKTIIANTILVDVFYKASNNIKIFDHETFKYNSFSVREYTFKGKTYSLKPVLLLSLINNKDVWHSKDQQKTYMKTPYGYNALIDGHTYRKHGIDLSEYRFLIFSIFEDTQGILTCTEYALATQTLIQEIEKSICD